MLGKLLRINAEPWVLLIFLVIALLTSSLACSRQDSAMAPPSSGNQQLSVDNLLVDIELLDTINRLELTSQQFDELVEIAIRLENIGNTYDQRSEQIKRQLQPILARKRDLLVKDQPPSEELQAELDQGQQQLQQVADERAAALGQLIPDLRKVLTDS